MAAIQRNKAKTVIIMSSTNVKSVDDIKKFTTKLQVDEILKLIKKAEDEIRSSDEVVRNIKIQSLERR